jgi:hypothetical protein
MLVLFVSGGRLVKDNDHLLGSVVHVKKAWSDSITRVGACRQVHSACVHPLPMPLGVTSPTPSRDRSDSVVGGENGKERWIVDCGDVSRPHVVYAIATTASEDKSSIQQQ